MNQAIEREHGLHLYLHNDRLYKLCQQQDLTVEQLCHQADVHPMVVDRAEWGGSIAREDVTKLAIVLAVEPDSLIVYSVEEIRKRQMEGRLSRTGSAWCFTPLSRHA